LTIKTKVLLPLVVQVVAIATEDLQETVIRIQAPMETPTLMAMDMEMTTANHLQINITKEHKTVLQT
jgi:hypothetical protein